MTNKKHKFSKQNPYMTAAKTALMILTAVYPVFMVMMTGAGLISNKDSYGSVICGYGIYLIASGTVMTAAAILCLFRKSLANFISPLLSSAGFVLCMIITYKLVKHAESAGWSGVGRYENIPVSNMYKERILPTTIPFLLTIAISAIQFFSYDAREERRLRKKLRKEKENAAAPPIIGD
jgi:hypothetical protein